jgi:hypothetical protein
MALPRYRCESYCLASIPTQSCGFLIFGVRWVVGVIICAMGFGLHRVFCLTPGILDLAFGLLHGTLRLSVGVSGPFTDLTFDATGDVFHFPFGTIFIHDSLRLMQGQVRPWFRTRLPCPSNHRTSALNHADQDNDDGDDEQDVNEPSQRVGADHSQQPKDQKQYCNCPKHRSGPPNRRVTAVRGRLTGGRIAYHPWNGVSTHLRSPNDS